jgi:hypothetical protein
MDVDYNATAHVASEQICEKMIYYTYHRYMFGPQCVCADVPSGYLTVGKICYTHHRYRDALHYVSVDGTSDVPSV